MISDVKCDFEVFREYIRNNLNGNGEILPCASKEHVERCFEFKYFVAHYRKYSARLCSKDNFDICITFYNSLESIDLESIDPSGVDGLDYGSYHRHGRNDIYAREHLCSDLGDPIDLLEKLI